MDFLHKTDFLRFTGMKGNLFTLNILNISDKVSKIVN